MFVRTGRCEMLRDSFSWPENRAREIIGAAPCKQACASWMTSEWGTADAGGRWTLVGFVFYAVSGGNRYLPANLHPLSSC